MSEFATWHVQPCDECGQNTEYSRSIPRALGEPHICTQCAMFERGYQDGIASLTDRLRAAEALADLALKQPTELDGYIYDPAKDWAPSRCVSCDAEGVPGYEDDFEHDPDCAWIAAREAWRKVRGDE